MILTSGLPYHVHTWTHTRLSFFFKLPLGSYQNSTAFLSPSPSLPSTGFWGYKQTRHEAMKPMWRSEHIFRDCSSLLTLCETGSQRCCVRQATWSMCFWGESYLHLPACLRSSGIIDRHYSIWLLLLHPGAGKSNSGPHTWLASTFPTEPSPRPSKRQLSYRSSPWPATVC